MYVCLYKYIAIFCIHTGKPIESDLIANPSVWKEDEVRRVEKPFSLKEFLNTFRAKITASNETDLFEHKLYKSGVKLLGYGDGKKSAEYTLNFQ